MIEKKKGIELSAISNNSQEKYVVLALCGDCQTELNRTKEMTGQELHKHWTMIVMSSGFNTGKCPKGCRATYSDLNINTDTIIEKDSPHPIQKEEGK